MLLQVHMRGPQLDKVERQDKDLRVHASASILFTDRVVNMHIMSTGQSPEMCQTMLEFHMTFHNLDILISLTIRTVDKILYK